MVQQQRLLEVFVELADTLVADFDAVDLMYTLAQVSVELLDADAAGLMLSDQRGNLQAIASSSDESQLLELFELQHQEGPCLDCFALGRPVVNVGPAEAVERWPSFGPAVREAGFSTVHAVPLRLRNEVIGAMNLFVRGERELADDDVALAQGLADMATIGLLQERAIQEGHLLAEQLQGALNSRVTIEQGSSRHRRAASGRYGARPSGTHLPTAARRGHRRDARCRASPYPSLSPGRCGAEYVGKPSM